MRNLLGSDRDLCQIRHSDDGCPGATRKVVQFAHSTVACTVPVSRRLSVAEGLRKGRMNQFMASYEKEERARNNKQLEVISQQDYDQVE